MSYGKLKREKKLPFKENQFVFMHFWVGETCGLPGTKCVVTPVVHSTCSQGNAPVFTLQVSIANHILLPPPQQQFAVP